MVKFLEIEFHFSAYSLETKLYFKLINFYFSRKT